MTVGTNALLEERGARTALVANAGFGDLLEIGRQDRPELYRLCAPKPTPLVEPGMRFEAPGRIGPAGELEPLDEAEIERVVADVAEAEPESVAICLLFSYLDPCHEERLAARAAGGDPRRRTSPPRAACCRDSASSSAARPR